MEWNTIQQRGQWMCIMCLLVFMSFIDEMRKKGRKDFVFYSDSCFSQNENMFYATMLWYCLQKLNMSSITHKYLEKGHAFNENDSVHSIIETASKNIPVYTTPTWAATRPKRPYEVKEMTLQDFLDFKKVAENIKNFEINTKNDKVQWSKIRVLKLTSSNPN